MLTKCIECGGKVSDKATTCPHCGAPVPVPDLKKVEFMKSDNRESALSVENGQSNSCKSNEGGASMRTTTSGPQKSPKTLRRYVLEGLIILVIVIAAPFVMGICNLIAQVVLEGFHAVEQSFPTAVAFSILYLAWPIELIVRKYNSPKTGRMIGNILMTLLALFVVFGTLGVVNERTLCQGGGFFSMGLEKTDYVPFAILALGVWYIRTQRKYRDPIVE